MVLAALSACTMDGDWICRGRVFPDVCLLSGGGTVLLDTETAGLGLDSILVSRNFLGTGGGNEPDGRGGRGGNFALLLLTLLLF